MGQFFSYTLRFCSPASYQQRQNYCFAQAKCRIHSPECRSGCSAGLTLQLLCISGEVSCLLQVARSKGVAGETFPNPCHHMAKEGERGQLSCPHAFSGWLTCASVSRVSCTVLPLAIMRENWQPTNPVTTENKCYEMAHHNFCTAGARHADPKLQNLCFTGQQENQEWFQSGPSTKGVTSQIQINE